MSNPFVSVIVPVYNVERYLPRCIESILGQTYTNFELILIDDGTPDRSGIICDRYAEKDSRIRVIHKENGGVSTARNAGIDAARGEWITFIDSDDWVSDKYLEILVGPLNKEKYDIVVAEFEYHHFKILKRIGEERSIDISSINNENVFGAICKMEFSGPCFKLFSMEIIKLYNLSFPENVAVAEDAIFVKSYLKFCTKIYVAAHIVYYYNRLNNFSVTVNNPYFEERIDWDTQYIDTYIDTLSTLGVEEQLIQKEISKQALGLFSTHVRSVINSFGKKEAEEKIEKLAEYYVKWIDVDFEKAETEKNKLLIRCLVNKDAEVIYNLLKTKQNRLIGTAKTVIKRIVGSFIEKHRDGLKKYKF